MQKMKMSLILPLMICLNGCSKINLPTIEDQERCVASIKFNKCRCHTYKVSKEKIGRVSDSVDKPLNYCDNLVGFSPKSWVNYVLWFEEIFIAVDDANENNLEKPDIETDKDIDELFN